MRATWHHPPPDHSCSTATRVLAFHLRACFAPFIVLLPVACCSTPENSCSSHSIDQWSADGETEVYFGDVIHITGGAEIYHEYGFVQVAVQRYVRGANSISVELHTMDGDAFGV